MRESTLETKLTKAAKNLDIITLKLQGSGDVGKPDRLFVYAGKCVFIELKGSKTVVKPKQIWWCNKLNKQGTPALISNNYEECMEFLIKQLIERK
tara:strand:- start:428 stop:712 length:285 start_codon:yes stop_codon:yes gene_type:complete